MCKDPSRLASSGTSTSVAEDVDSVFLGANVRVSVSVVVESGEERRLGAGIGILVVVVVLISILISILITVLIVVLVVVSVSLVLSVVLIRTTVALIVVVLIVVSVVGSRVLVSIVAVGIGSSHAVGACLNCEDQEG